MDTRNSVLVVAVYLAGGVVVLVMGLGYFAYQRSLVDSRGMLNLADDNRLEGSVHHRALTAKFAAAATKSGPSLRELQSSLAATREMLEKSRTALNQRNEECRLLKDELDESFSLILNLLLDESRRDVELSDSSERAQVKLENELAHLRESLDRSERLDAERERQFSQFQIELIQADLQLAMIDQESQRELDGLAAEKRTLEDITSALIARCGEVAVPWLIELLADERVEVRRWSVRALGEIGPEARDAIPMLHEFLADPDSEVRTRAKRALAAITEVQIINY